MSFKQQQKNRTKKRKKAKAREGDDREAALSRAASELGQEEVSLLFIERRVPPKRLPVKTVKTGSKVKCKFTTIEAKSGLIKRRLLGS